MVLLMNAKTNKDLLRCRWDLFSHIRYLQYVKRILTQTDFDIKWHLISYTVKRFKTVIRLEKRSERLIE